MPRTLPLHPTSLMMKRFELLWMNLNKGRSGEDANPEIARLRTLHMYGGLLDSEKTALKEVFKRFEVIYNKSTEDELQNFNIKQTVATIMRPETEGIGAAEHANRYFLGGSRFSSWRGVLRSGNTFWLGVTLAFFALCAAWELFILVGAIASVYSVLNYAFHVRKDYAAESKTFDKVAAICQREGGEYQAPGTVPAWQKELLETVENSVNATHTADVLPKPKPKSPVQSDGPLHTISVPQYKKSSHHRTPSVQLY